MPTFEWNENILTFTCSEISGSLEASGPSHGIRTPVSGVSGTKITNPTRSNYRCYPTPYGNISVTLSDFIKNTCVGHTNNFQLDSDDTCGPIVTNSGSLPTSGAAAHTWANFSR